MSNYTKTTDFGAKDSLPTGDSGKIIRGTEFETEFDAISTAIATKADIAGPTFTGTLTYETISDGTISITAFVDEDDMSSNSANLVPTQQSVKAYVDAVTTELQAQDLDFQADTGGALNIDLDTETMTFTGGTGIDTSGSGNAVTFAIDSTVTTLTGTQTLTNKTLTSPDVNTPDIDGGTIDGTVIGGSTAAAGSFTTVSATGNITVSGTVDGRDVATDGTKLDGIEAGATADQTDAEIRAAVEAATDSNVFTDADHTKLDGIEANATADQTDAEIRAAVEAATDSNVFTDADHTKLDGIEAGADVTDTTNVTAAGALMDSELTNITAVKALDQGVATTDTPTFAGLATSANVTFGDNDKAIFGAGSDLEIYHDGSTSFIRDSGTGDLQIRASNLLLTDVDGTIMLDGRDNGKVSIHHNGAEKLTTTSTGIDVTGTVTADGLTVDGGTKFSGSADESSSGGLSLKVGLIDASISNSTDAFVGVHDTGGLGSLAGDLLLVPRSSTGVANSIQLFSGQTTPKLRQKISDNGDISFYEDTGTTAKLFWDASAESLGIGTSSIGSSTKLQVAGRGLFTDGLPDPADGSPAGVAIGYNTTSGYGFIQAIQTGVANKDLYLQPSGSNNVIIANSGGNVGIGTDSPSFINGSGLEIQRAGVATLRLEDTGSSGKAFELSVDDGTGAVVNSASSGLPMIFKVINSEAMRLDTSGNLLVSKTSNDNSTAGVVLRDTGEGSFVVSAGRSGLFNRLSSDGEIINFRKDNTTVGSIASRAGVVTTIVLNPASGNGAGLSGGTKAVVPADEAGIVDNDISLGVSTHRFKDLHLSGGAYLGGTASANKLDDYEEGTWNVSFQGATVTPANTYGHYTKIGRVVYFSYYSGASTIASASGGGQIGGLPFTVLNDSTAYVPGSVAHNTFFGGSTTAGVEMYANAGNTNIIFTIRGTTGAASFVDGSNKSIMISGFYITS